MAELVMVFPIHFGPCQNSPSDQIRPTRCQHTAEPFTWRELRIISQAPAGHDMRLNMHGIGRESCNSEIKINQARIAGLTVSIQYHTFVWYAVQTATNSSH